MRVAYVNADGGIPVHSDKGAAIHIREMVAAFAAIGCETRVLTNRLGEAAGPAFPAPVELVCEPVRAADAPAGREGKERAFITSADAMRERLVALHREWPFDMIYERYSLWSTAAVDAAEVLGVPAVIEVNAPLVPEQAAYRKLVLEDHARRVEREVFSRAHALAAVSRGVADYVVAGGAPAERVHVIGNAVDTGRFNPQAATDRRGIAADAFVVGFTGSLRAWHGIDVLARAFRELRTKVHNAHLLIVGDGPMHGWLEGFLAGAGLEDAATLTGWVGHEDLPGLIAGMDVATAPYPASDDFYFSPLKLYEYLAIGRPIVASRIGQVADVIDDGRSGLLVEPGDHTALADALAALAADRALADRLAAGAAAEGARHTWTRNAGAVLDLARRARRAA